MALASAVLAVVGLLGGSAHGVVQPPALMRTSGYLPASMADVAVSSFRRTVRNQTVSEAESPILDLVPDKELKALQLPLPGELRFR